MKIFAIRRRPVFDRERLLDRLPESEYHPAEDAENDFARASLPQVALLLAGVDQEREYRLCRETAERLIGAVPDADEIPE